MKRAMKSSTAEAVGRSGRTGCSAIWVLLDSNDGLKLASGFCFSTEEVARSYCKFPGEFPFLLTMLTKAKHSRQNPTGLETVHKTEERR